MEKFNLQFANGMSGVFQIDIPNNCPHCGRTIYPKRFGAPILDGYIEKLPEAKIVVLLRCTFQDCQKFFIAVYNIHERNDRMADYKTEIIDYSYMPPINIDLPENINAISSDFVEIYGQAIQAEQFRLTKISGIGYRKALEFLIKDYAIHTAPNDIDKIKKIPLGQVIDKYLNDFPKIQKLAKASAWIGNDETHYEKRFNSDEVISMKKFIKSAATFISADIEADAAAEFIEVNNPKKN